MEVGHVGVVIGPAPQGHATIVEFSGIQATISSQRLLRAADKPLGKKRGRKKQGDSTSTLKPSSEGKSVDKMPSTSEMQTSVQLITQLANALLLNGGLKEDSDVTIQIRFAELPEPIQAQIHALIEAKLALRAPAGRK